ncbi:hypothetical protein TCSYLVIO_010437, partial [Trypanosoma cruzi]
KQLKEGRVGKKKKRKEKILKQESRKKESKNTHKKKKEINKKPKRGTTSAHTLIAPVKQNTHTGREREKGRPLNAIKTKQKQLRCSTHAARQDGSGACRAKESTNGPAWVCMHIYNGHIIVCASWGEVRARVHARGHTHREKDECVCGRCMALSSSLSRGHRRTRNNKKKQKRGGGVGDRGAAVTVTVGRLRRIIPLSGCGDYYV